ncbi:MraY family glycosyltransferase [Chryseosolibacter indicus]|uniref:Glycosyltransferase family 4 protein n=1 Tax=Chryseosolibacter indicus TaxID=2782351 RepID=A0ABS5VV75_9BACT|nr:glycosyltransferase family 4 protein [Chryseosolibacter indicus]MBT1705345.1 glycosyltransferase family 4 protein [Chryseosolibacter indicus]
MLPYLILAVLLFVIELLFFKVADRFNIIDKPNQRSSHTKPVIRGGGMIFVVAVLIWFVYSGFLWPWFVIALAAIAFISFADDIKSQPSLLRFMVHLGAVIMMFYEVGLFVWPWWLLILVLIVAIGALNTFNFMDGINGITGMYAQVSLSTFLFIDQKIYDFTEESLVITSLISVVVFLFFNYRKKAKCFAGDVGSISIAFVQLFLLLQLIFETGNFLWVIMVLVYGVDSVITILYRLKRKENIFKPHRTHLYQYLSNEFKVPHRFVSLVYGLLQLMLNVFLIYFIIGNSFSMVVLIAFLYVVAYVIIREWLLRKLALSPTGR